MKLSRTQTAIVGLAVVWLALSLVQESISFSSSPLLSAEDSGFLKFSIPITLLGTVGPLLMAAWLCWKTRQCLDHRGGGNSFYAAARIELEGNAGIALVVFVLWFPILFPAYLFIEDFGAVSVMPLTTPACGILAALIGQLVFRRMKTESRLTLLSLLICSILALQHLDWNPRKSLLRDLYRIRIGMTIAEVDRIMKSHNIGPGLPDDLPVDSSEQDRRFIYISGPGAAYNADLASITIQAGRVATVQFSHD